MKLLIWDFSRTILFPKDKNYNGSLNKLRKESTESFNNLFDLNMELLEFIKSLNVNSIIFTTGTVQNDSSISDTLKEIFIGIENVDSVGYQKDDKNAYIELSNKYDVSPKDIVFIDDSNTNLEAAKQAGLNIVQYTSNNNAITRITEILKQS